MAFELPDLPFKRDALEPHMSKTTLEYHHGKHHKAYIDKLNEAIEGTPRETWSLERIVADAAGKSGEEFVFNQAGQAWNHSFFWSCLSPDGGGAPDGELREWIERDFGSLDDFRKAFRKAATKKVFGSGWTWLVVEDGRLAVVSTSDANTPIAHGQVPLLTLDMWEHAYYLDYKNDKGSFVDAYLGDLVNWAFAAENLANQEDEGPARRRAAS